MIGHAELGLDLRPIVAHFSEFLSADTIAAVMSSAIQITPLPPPPAGVTRIDSGGMDAPSPIGDIRPVPTVLPDAAVRRAPSVVPGAAPRAPAVRPPYPAVSCICLTYGRPEVLEEAIHSFLL